MKRTYEKERVAALSAGLAVIVLAWIAVQAFASDWIDSIGVLSVWLYGPISAAHRTDDQHHDSERPRESAWDPLMAEESVTR
jgi:hypothetical protein